MSRLRLRKIGSLLALLAVLMSVLAPAISQTLAQKQRLGDALVTVCSVDRAPVAPSKRPADHSLAHWQACPYCGLLAHTPVLPGIAVQLAAGGSAAPVPTPFVGPAAPTVAAHTVAQPRAPPVFS